MSTEQVAVEERAAKAARARARLTLARARVRSAEASLSLAQVQARLDDAALKADDLRSLFKQGGLDIYDRDGEVEKRGVNVVTAAARFRQHFSQAVDHLLGDRSALSRVLSGDQFQVAHPSSSSPVSAPAAGCSCQETPAAGGSHLSGKAKA